MRLNRLPTLPAAFFKVYHNQYFSTGAVTVHVEFRGSVIHGERSLRVASNYGPATHGGLLFVI